MFVNILFDPTKAYQTAELRAHKKIAFKEGINIKLPPWNVLSTKLK